MTLCVGVGMSGMGPIVGRDTTGCDLGSGFRNCRAARLLCQRIRLNVCLRPQRIASAMGVSIRAWVVLELALAWLVEGAARSSALGRQSRG